MTSSFFLLESVLYTEQFDNDSVLHIEQIT